MTPRKTHTRSDQIFHEAEQFLVGGVNSPVRAFRSVGGTPLVMARGTGARIEDADGNSYLDYVGSWGPLILGHAVPAVVSGVSYQAARGTSFGMTSELEVELARLICRAMPSMGMIRFVSSGTEAAMSAARIARAATGRSYLVKFSGCYHGHADPFLSEAGSGLATLGIPSSPGVPEALAALTLNLPYNDPEAIERAFTRYPGKIAAVFVEPVAANMGVVPPESGFLHGLREITRREGALLVFDEVITGFRVAHGGAQAMYDVRPDLTILGKIIGGGLPVAAYGGRRDLMSLAAPLGQVYQAGTLSGNPLAMRAGIETLRQLERPGFYESLESRSRKLTDGIRALIAERRYPACINAIGSLATLFFTPGPVRNFAEARQADTARYAKFFWEMLERGVFLAPSQFEAMFVSGAHTDDDVGATLVACSESLRAVFSG
ncbi:MAG TPA: glutamate-1-semialdehyde 2,1-aminomutase [Patescibacteria group bacterium]|nr:glutamate-1-semialdehyde 2,1-aminomutase [Patescibacteria group bacterium]